MRAKYWLADATVPTGDFTGWFATHWPLLAAAGVIAAVAVALWRGIPKWVIGLVALLAILVVLGVVAK